MDWEQWFLDKTTPWRRDKIHPALKYWIESEALKPCKILVPGCGDCLELKFLADQGFDVVGIDVSSTAIAMQREILGNIAANLIVDNMFDWQPDHQFDAVYEQTCLCAINPKQRAAYEAKLYDWLKPDGVLFANFMQKSERGGPPYDCSLDAMRYLFPADRWQWLETFQTSEPFHMQGAFEEGRLLKKLS